MYNRSFQGHLDLEIDGKGRKRKKSYKKFVKENIGLIIIIIGILILLLLLYKLYEISDKINSRSLDNIDFPERHMKIHYIRTEKFIVPSELGCWVLIGDGTSLIDLGKIEMISSYKVCCFLDDILFSCNTDSLLDYRILGVHQGRNGIFLQLFVKTRDLVDKECTVSITFMDDST